jgi:hypothetical protein
LVRRRAVAVSASICKLKYGEPRHKGGAAKFVLLCYFVAEGGEDPPPPAYAVAI